MDKQSKILLSLIVFIGIIACLMLLAYIINFRYGFSDNSSDWGSFGSYMGSITGLLAFMGVLYSIHNANKKTDKLREESQAQNERDLFFRLVDSHQKMMNSLIGKDLKTGEKTIGTHAIDVYKKELDANFQLLVMLWRTSLFPDHESWSLDIKRFARGEFEQTLFAALFYYDSGLINNKDKSLLDNEQIVNNVNSIKKHCFRELKEIFQYASDHNRLKPFYVNFSTEELTIY